MGFGLAGKAKTSGISTQTTGTTDMTGATLIVASFGSGSQGTPANPFTDSPAGTFADSSNTYTALTGQIDATVGARMYYAANPTVASTWKGRATYTSNFLSCFWAGYSGVQSSSPLDSEAAGNISDPIVMSLSANPSNFTPAASGCLIVTAIGYATGTNSVALAIDNGFTVEEFFDYDGATRFSGGLADSLSSGYTSGAVGVTTFSWSVSSSAAAVMAAFLPITGVTLTLVKGDLTLASAAGTIVQQQPYTVSNGSLTLAGQVVSLPGSGNYTVVAGSALLNGFAVTMSVTGPKNLVKGDLALTGYAVSVAIPIPFIVIAPYLTTDTIGTKSFQVYGIVGGVLTPIGSAVTTGFTAIPNVTNGWWVSFEITANGSFGDFAGLAIFTNINGSGARAVELYSPPTLVPNSLSIVKVADFAPADVINTPGYQLYDETGAALGGHVTSGIVSLPSVTNGYATTLTLTPDTTGAFRGGILWDGG